MAKYIKKQRVVIYKAHVAGESIANAAKVAGVSGSTAHNWVAKWKDGRWEAPVAGSSTTTTTTNTNIGIKSKSDYGFMVQFTDLVIARVADGIADRILAR